MAGLSTAELSLQVGEHTIRAGDLIQFQRLTLENVAASGNWCNLAGWFTGLTIAAFTAPRGGLEDGRHEQSHSAIVIVWQGQLCVLEFTAAGGIKRGMVITPLKQRLDAYPGAVEIVPLSERYRHLFTEERVAAWIELHQYDEYRAGGLPFAGLTIVLYSWNGVGAMFCSEAIIRLLLYCTIIPRALRVVRGDHHTEGEVLAHRYAPRHVPIIPQFAINSAWFYKQGLKLKGAAA